MAQILKIKRGQSVNLGSLVLQEGELAVALDTGKVYVGTGADKACINPDQEEIRIGTEDVEGLLTGGKIDESLLPAIAITEVFEVASQSEMLALSVQAGDVAVRSDVNKSFILKQLPSSTLANWVELKTPTDTVLSVNGKTGAVNLTASDVGLGNVTNESKATMFASPNFTGTPTAPTAAASANTTQIATTAFVKAQGYLDTASTIDGGTF